MKVLVTGGAGYVGCVLTEELLKQGHSVKVLDLFIFGEHVFDHLKDDARLEQIKGDIRDQALLKRVLPGCDAVIHLACISNDPSFELNPELSRVINFECFRPLVEISRDCGISRFIYASTASVYGVSEAPQVTEDHPLLPITDYNKYKGLCEPVLLEYESASFIPVVIRPATVCGHSPRQRLDLTVNILTCHAWYKNGITVFGGSQKRPNIHIRDIVDLYIRLLQEDPSRISGKIFNAGYQNSEVMSIAEAVRTVVSEQRPEAAELQIKVVPSDDIRSYHISSEKIQRELGFLPKHTIEDAVRELCQAFDAGLVPNALENSLYFNIKRMKEVKLA